MNEKLADYEQEYLKEQDLLDKIEDYLIDEVEIDRDLLYCMTDYNGRSLKIFKYIYQYITNNDDFDEIVEQLRKEL